MQLYIFHKKKTNFKFHGIFEMSWCISNRDIYIYIKFIQILYNTLLVIFPSSLIYSLFTFIHFLKLFQ